MSDQSFDRFCEQVCSVIRWKAVRTPVARELAAHLEDHAAALMERGVPQEEAARQAVEAMGDPYELGHELDRCHSPLMPRLSQIFTVTGVLALLLSLLIGVQNGTGLPDMAGLFPQFPSLPYDKADTLVMEGTSSGGGALGSYDFSTSGTSGLVYLTWTWEGETTEEYQVQVPITSTSRWPWLPAPKLYQMEAAWTDDTGGSGPCDIVHGSSYLLGSSGVLRISDPTPGARQFTVTLRGSGDELTLYITLPEEVPEL